MSRITSRLTCGLWLMSARAMSSVSLTASICHGSGTLLIYYRRGVDWPAACCWYQPWPWALLASPPRWSSGTRRTLSPRSARGPGGSPQSLEPNNRLVRHRVVDPHWFNADPGSSIFLNCGLGSSSESRVLMTENLKNIYSCKTSLYFLDQNRNLFILRPP